MADFNQAAKWYDSWLLQLYLKRVYALSLNFVQPYLKSCQRILDIGCGTGNWLVYLQKQLAQMQLEMSGIDLSEAMLKIALNKLPAANFTQGEAENLPYQDSAFDFIFIIEALHHFSQQEQALREANRVLKESGLLFIFDPSLDNPFSRLLWRLVIFTIALEKNSRYFHLNDLIALLKNNNFEIIKSKSSFGNNLILAKKPK